MTPRHDYAAMLRARHELAREDREAAAPVGLTAWRARRDLDRWRAEYARRGGRDAPRLVATVGDLDQQHNGRP